jgi:hypothetical protein
MKKSNSNFIRIVYFYSINRIYILSTTITKIRRIEHILFFIRFSSKNVYIDLFKMKNISYKRKLNYQRYFIFHFLRILLFQIFSILIMKSIYID